MNALIVGIVILTVAVGALNSAVNFELGDAVSGTVWAVSSAVWTAFLVMKLRAMMADRKV